MTIILFLLILVYSLFCFFYVLTVEKEKKNLEDSLDYYRSKTIDDENTLLDVYNLIKKHYEVK